MTDSTSSGRRRIAIVRHSHVYEASLSREVDAFREAGLDVNVFMLEGDGEPAGSTTNDGITIHRLRGTKSRGSKIDYFVEYGAFIIRAATRLTREHRYRRFELVQVNTMPDYLVLATVLLRLRGVKVSVFMKEPTPELSWALYRSRALRRLLEVVENLVLRYAHLAFTVTPELRETYIERGADPHKLHVVLNCPAADLFDQSLQRPRTANDRFVVISHGTIEHRWGHDVMLEAVHLARTDIPEIELQLTGAGSYLDEVLRKVDEYGLQDHVSYLGWLDYEDVVAVVANADAGVVAQLSSPYSNLVHTNKMFEFIMLNVPCVASRLRSVSASFSDDEILFYEPDDPQSLAHALIRLRNEPGLAESLVRGARQRYENGYRWADQKNVLVGETLALLG